MSDMTELFLRDPMELSEQDIDKIIEEMRAKRHTFNAQPAAATKKKAEPKLTKSQSEVKKLGLDIDLGDL